MNKKNQSLKDEIKKNTKKSYQNTKKLVQEGKEKINKTRQSSAWQKAKGVTKKAITITESHLATTKASIVLSNEEAELMENLKSKLNEKEIYPSKSEILRAGLWNLRNKNPGELEEMIKDLLKIKQTRIL